MALGVAVGAERAQVPRLVTPAKLAPDNVIDLDGERPARAPETVTS